MSHKQLDLFYRIIDTCHFSLDVVDIIGGMKNRAKLVEVIRVVQLSVWDMLNKAKLMMCSVVSTLHRFLCFTSVL